MDNKESVKEPLYGKRVWIGDRDRLMQRPEILTIIPHILNQFQIAVYKVNGTYLMVILFVVSRACFTSSASIRAPVAR